MIVFSKCFEMFSDEKCKNPVMGQKSQSKMSPGIYIYSSDEERGSALQRRADNIGAFGGRGHQGRATRGEGQEAIAPPYWEVGTTEHRHTIYICACGGTAEHSTASVTSPLNLKKPDFLLFLRLFSIAQSRN